MNEQAQASKQLRRVGKKKNRIAQYAFLYKGHLFSLLILHHIAEAAKPVFFSSVSIIFIENLEQLPELNC